MNLKQFKKTHKLTKKIMKAPPYYKEHLKMVKEMEKEVADLCQMSISWVQAQLAKPNANEVMMEMARERKWDEETKRKVILLSQVSDLFIDYCQARFRYEHRNDMFGKSDTLYYDKTTDEMVVQWLIPRIKQFARKILLADSSGRIIGKAE